MSNNRTELTGELEKIAENARGSFGGFSEEQINWKPSPDKWSVGQCLDHLIVTNESEFPAVESIIGGQHKNPAWAKVPFLTNFFGGFVMKVVDPANAKKTKNPKVFSPASSSVEANIVSRFVDHQKKLIELMNATREVDWEKTVISSPVAVFVTYRLSDAYKIVVLHEQRHLSQAKRVTEAEGFPG